MTATAPSTRTAGSSRSAPPPAATVLVWVAVFAGIALWAIHIVASASLVRYACHERWAVWAMHGITAATSVLTVAALVACWRFTSGSDDRKEDGIAPLSQRRFLGIFGLGVNGISLALILLEGIYVVFLSPCI